MFYLRFCYNAHVHVADNVQERPLRSHFSVGRRIRCNTGTPPPCAPYSPPDVTFNDRYVLYKLCYDS